MAIYLFAQAHGMGKGSAGYLLVRNGALLLLIGVICFVIILAPDLMGQTQASMQEQVQSESAASYAVAQKGYAMATASQNFNELLEGRKGLTPPGPASPRAPRQSSQAENPSASAQLDESLRESIRQDEQVLNHLRGIGLAEPVELLNSLGLKNLRLGVNNHNPAKVHKSLEYLQRAEKRASLGGNSQEMAVTHLTQAISNLISGESPEIDPEAIRQIIGTEDRHLIINSFALLGVLERTYCSPPGNKPKLCAAVQKAKEQLVDTWPLPNSPSRPTSATIPDCGGHAGESTFIQVSPQAVQWQGQLPQFRRGSDRLVLVWYAKGRKETAWQVLPLVSGPVDPGELSAAKNSPESWVITRSLLTLSGYKKSLAAGLYKAELYLNGRLISAPPETRNAFDNFAAEPLSELNVGLCLPNSWEPLTASGLPGHINLYGRGFQSPQHHLNAFVFRFYTETLDKTAAVRRAKKRLAQGPWNIKDTDVFAPYDPGECKTVTPSPRGFYKYWFSPEGIEYVGIVLADAAPPCELYNILDSMGTIYQ